MSRTKADLGGRTAEIPCRTTHHHGSVLISLRNTDFDRTRSPGFSFSGQRVQLGSRNSCFCDKMLKYLVNFKMPQFLKETASHPRTDAAGPLQTGAESPHHHMCEQRGFQRREGRSRLRCLCWSGFFFPVQHAFMLSRVHLPLPF